MQRKNSGENFWEKKIRQFEKELTREEKSSTTIRKYMHDVRQFCLWLSQNGAETGKITKELTIAYKQDLMDHYRISSVNSMVAAVNRFLRFCGMQQMCIKTCRTQRQYFRKEEELTKEEYLLLVETAERTGRIRLKLLMQTLACTGIRVQELTSVTVEHVREGKLEICNKGKRRQVYLPRKLRKELLSYCADNGISQGPVFLTFGGQVPDSREELMELPGVGRKTANVVLSNAFGVPAFAVDTHVFRVSNRLGLCRADTVEETERQMTELIPEEKWGKAHHWLIWHGRRVCRAQRPLCGECTLKEWCPSCREGAAESEKKRT